ncbi:MAG: molybdenum cofactor biosynthesis protein MoaE [Candidatus Bathyarchaeota archaeon]|nr:MAG: molybdenum cofactor biosynthesis protein MoaE [Candidatus Bathyarchaeota archaeon]
MARRAGVYKKGALGLYDIIQTAKANKDFHKAGGIALFIGFVRNETKDKRKVKKLELEAYEEKANEVLERICNDLNRRDGIIDVQIHHLLGEFNVGEELVYVLVAGAHRRELFPILQEAVELYKKEAPIFKKEYIINKEGKTESFWVSEQERKDD